MLAQTWHEFKVLDAMGESSGRESGGGGGAVEVTVAASEAFARNMVPFARALNHLTQGTGQWRMMTAAA